MEMRSKPKVGFVPCLSFVQRGVANPTLVKMKASKEELQEMMKELRLREAEYRTRPSSQQRPVAGEPMSDVDAEHETGAVDDYYDLDNYDDEPVESGVSYTSDAMLLNPAPDSDPDWEDDSDEEAEEFQVQPNDNIIIAGHVGDDVCLLQLYVLNVEKQEFFLFNDTYLPSYPLSLEWLDFDPKHQSDRAHLAAVGYMTPEIQIWDLNKSDCLEPMLTLGSKKKKTMRHRDAVLSLAWNTNARSCLASGSADGTSILWDLRQETAVARFENLGDKVQSLKWHPLDTQSLLGGLCDGAVKLFDCANPGSHKTWQFEGEVERVMWNKFSPFYFFASTEKGMVHYVDIRTGKALWDLKAHNGAVGGLALSSFCRDFLVTGSQDETVKVWDLKDNQPTFVIQKDMNIGHIYEISSCPDSPYVFAAGGANPDNHLYVWDTRELPIVVERFKDRFNVVISDDDDDVEASAEEGSTSNPAFSFTQKEKPGMAEPSTSAGPSSSFSTAAMGIPKTSKKAKDRAMAAKAAKDGAKSSKHATGGAKKKKEKK